MTASWVWCCNDWLVLMPVLHMAGHLYQQVCSESDVYVSDIRSDHSTTSQFQNFTKNKSGIPVCSESGDDRTLAAVQNALRTRFRKKLPRHVYFCGLLWKRARTGPQLIQTEETKHDFDFANAIFSFLCLALGINWCSSGWVHVKWFSKRTLHNHFFLAD